MKLLRAKGATSITLHVFIRDSSSSTGAGLTGLVYNSAGLKAYYVRPRATPAAITLATQTVTGAWSSGGFVEMDATNMPGWYRFDVPDAVFASGVDFVGIHLFGATNMEPVPIEIQLSDLMSSVDSIYVGTVASGSTTTSLKDTGLTQTDADHWKGRIVIFISGALKYQATDITAFDQATDTLTVTSLTTAPAAGDKYVVL